MTNEQPVVLELAPLPREQIGPFLLLGLEKDADKEQIEANWAQRLIWARKRQIGVALQEINWAREILNDPDRRVKADVASLNADTMDLVVRRLAQQFGAAGPSQPAWQPLDAEKPLAAYAPDLGVPDPETLRQAITVPEVPQEFPAVRGVLEQWIREPLNPWAIDL